MQQLLMRAVQTRLETVQACSTPCQKESNDAVIELCLLRFTDAYSFRLVPGKRSQGRHANRSAASRRSGFGAPRIALLQASWKAKSPALIGPIFDVRLPMVRDGLFKASSP
jgi:hypothetical protein